MYLGRIVLIDDDATDAELFARALRRSGTAGSLMVYSSVLNAIDDADAIDGADLMVVDQNMPYMKGPEVIRALRGRGVRVGRIVTFTSSSLDVDADLAREAGADDVVVKPVCYQGFLDTVIGILNDAARAGTATAAS